MTSHRTRKFLRLFAAAWPVLTALAAQAHDTWFEPQPSRNPREIRLALGTGNQFPQQEVTVGAGSLVQQGCRYGSTRPAKMRVVRDTERTLLLRSAVPAKRPAGGVTCWAQQQAFEVEITPDKIPVYLKEIAASPALRETWREMESRGVPWRERYTKHARIELFDDRAGAEAPPPAPVPMAMDIVLERPATPLRAGDKITFRVLRDGEPLKGFAVELRSSLSSFGIWLRTDDQGRATAPVPFAARWCLRGTDLRLSATEADRWESRFVTLTFEAGPRP